MSTYENKKRANQKRINPFTIQDYDALMGTVSDRREKNKPCGRCIFQCDENRSTCIEMPFLIFCAKPT